MAADRRVNRGQEGKRFPIVLKLLDTSFCNFLVDIVKRFRDWAYHIGEEYGVLRKRCSSGTKRFVSSLLWRMVVGSWQGIINDLVPHEQGVQFLSDIPGSSTPFTYFA